VEKGSSTTAIARGLAGVLSLTGNHSVERGAAHSLPAYQGSVRAGSWLWGKTGGVACCPGAKGKQVNIPAPSELRRG